MPWNSTSPNGSISVKDNRPKMQENTSYIETEMDKDHFWDSDANKDGHHRYVQMPASDDGGTPATPTDPSLANVDMDAVIYAKLKTASEAPAQQDTQLFFSNLVGATPYIMQLLGIRVMCCFDVDQSSKAVTVKYSHNITSLIRSSTGRYTATFPDLPSANYLALGAGVRSSSDAVPVSWEPDGSTDLSSKTETTFKFQFRKTTGGSSDGDLNDPLQGWFVIFGG